MRVIRGEISPRVALSLVYDLPMESRTQADLRGGEEYLGWTQDRYVSVATFNILQQLLFVQAQSKTKAKVPRPKPIPLPGDRPQTPKRDENGFEAMLARAKAKKEQKQGV